MTDQHQTEAQRLAALLRSRNNNPDGFGLGPICDRAADELLRLNSAHVALERVSMQLFACGVVAMADTPDSAREARAMHPEYESLACDDVKRRVDECIALRARVAELEDVLTNLPLSSPQRMRARIQRLEEMLAAVGAGGVGPLIPATVQHQREPSSDNDLPIENGQLITSRSTVPADWKPVPLELTQAMLDQLRFGWSDISTAHVFDRWKRTVAAAPKPPTVEECLTDELKPRFSAHDDAERLKSVARGMSYNDHGEAVWKHTLMEIAVRLESGGYAAPQPPVVEQHTDDAAVNRFAEAMKAKLVVARDKGRGGWDDPAQCTVEYLAKLLVDHIAKGDPIDVANFAMMLHQRQADKSVLSAAAPTPPAVEQPRT